MTGKLIQLEKVLDVLRAYKAEGVVWDALAVWVLDVLIQEFMSYYDRWRKCCCRACGCQSKDHIGSRLGCISVPNRAPVSTVRIIDLCCNRAHQEMQVSTYMHRLMGSGVSPVAPQGGLSDNTRFLKKDATGKFTEKVKHTLDVPQGLGDQAQH